MAGKPERSGRPPSQRSIIIERNMDLMAASDDIERRAVLSMMDLLRSRRMLRRAVADKNRALDIPGGDGPRAA